MMMKTISVSLGLAMLVGPGCAMESRDGEEAASEAASRTLLASESLHSMPAVARAYETARAIDRSRALDARAGDAPAAKLAAPGDIITVSGRVLQLSGASVAHLPVVILGQAGAAAKTDENGDFTIPNVTAPYDVVVGFHQGTTTNMVIYEGLLRPDPRLVAFAEPEFFATITGFVSGGAGFPQPPRHFAFVGIGSDRGGMGFSQVFSPFGEYASSAQWGFADSTTAHLTALQFGVDEVGGLNFTGAATARFPVSAGAVVNVPVPLLPVKTATIAGTYTVPAGYTRVEVVPALESVKFSLFPIPVIPVDGGTFSLVAPVIPDRPIFVVVDATSPTGGLSQVARRGITSGTTDLAIDVPEAPDVIDPPDGATGIDHNTLFRATEFTAGVHLFQFQASTEEPTFTVVSSDPVARIPDLSALGAPLTPSRSYSLFLTGIGPYADVDDFAGPTGPLPSPELIFVFAPEVRFTTAP